jgi:hypothetical protein
MHHAPKDAIQDKKELTQGAIGEIKQAPMPRTVIGATSGSESKFAGIE